MRRKLLLPIIVALLCISNSAVLADVVILKTGVKKEGVIVYEDEEGIRLQTKIGTIGFTHDLIESIIRSSRKGNDLLLLRWEREKQLRERERMESLRRLRAFESEQKAKGLVKYQGRWMTPAEADARLRAEAAKREQPAPKASTSPKEKEQTAPEDPLLKLVSVIASEPRRTQGANTMVTCRITNKALRSAASVTIRVICYSKQGVALASVEATSRRIRSDGHSNLRVSIPVGFEDVGAIKASVVEAQWQ